ncbi:MAG: LysM peptidoglycan-binding domain-containing protein [Oscillochloris sp.]|nr:LysM peptidoglycan-binding domain-containing protein [Oscillochloris sp.]
MDATLAGMLPAAVARPAPSSARSAATTARPATVRTSGPLPVPGTNYVVQRGDYLRLLSSWSYGNEMLWPIIYDANQRVIGRNPDLIFPGQVFAIPTCSGTANPQPVRAYVVQPGDTLSSIALRVYGNAGRWSEIYRANSKLIGTFPNLILPGTRLLLP